MNKNINKKQKKTFIVPSYYKDKTGRISYINTFTPCAESVPVIRFSLLVSHMNIFIWMFCRSIISMIAIFSRKHCLLSNIDIDFILR